MDKNREAGMTMVELVVATMLTALVFAMGIAGFRSFVTKDSATQIGNESDEQLFMAAQRIMIRGRTAQSCAKVGSDLQCQMDLDVPSVGVFTPARFTHDAAAGAVLFQVRPGVGPWVTRERYAGVAAFTVCDNAEMQAGTCAIVPAGLSQRPQWAGADGRFFRYQLRGPNTSVRPTVLRGAFYVRNPVSFFPGATYVTRLPQ